MCLKNFLYPVGFKEQDKWQKVNLLFIYFFRNVFFLADGPAWFNRQQGRRSLLCVHARIARSCDHAIIPVVSRVFKENNSQTRLFLPAWTV